jgi:hypothetical protein
MVQSEWDLNSIPDIHTTNDSDDALHPTISHVCSWLETRYPEWWEGEELGPIRVSVLLGRRPGRSILFVFRGRDRWPQIVVKIATNEESARQLSREGRSLDRAKRELNGLLIQPLPRHLGSIQEPGVGVLATTALRGQRATLPDFTNSSPGWSDRRYLKSHIDAVRAWSRTLAKIGRPDTLKRDTHHSAERIERFIVLGNLSDPARVGFESLANAIARSGVSWSPRWQHGDIAPGNVLWHKGNIRLVDWEASSPEHDPWRDDAYLTLSLARLAQHRLNLSTVSDALQSALGSEDWAGRALADSYQVDWPHPIPIGWAMLTTTVEHALEREEYGTTTPYWRDLAIDLVCNDDLRATCEWLVPRW